MIALALYAFPGHSADLDRYDSLHVGDTVYRNAVVRSWNDSALIVSHSKGIAQVPLNKLSRDLQTRYGYDPESDANRKRELESMRRTQIEASKQRLDEKRKEAARASAAKRSRSFVAFGDRPVFRAEVDFRPRYRELGIGVRDQGRLPSCAIHAVVGAIEFLEGSSRGEAENLSEYYLYWATLKTLGRYGQSRLWNRNGKDDDAGFMLPEVLQAMRTYGIPSVNEAPGLGNRAPGQEPEDPSASIIQSARKRSAIQFFAVPGRSMEVLLGNIVHALNAGSPVVVSMGWPYYHTIRNSAYLEHQKPRPGYGHAVTLVGYRCPSGKLEDISFIFRNSWGSDWGAGGYGFVKYGYIEKHLFDAHVIEAGS